ncbi:phosphopantetheine-binding protein, partial [Pseudozobellia sp. WGM2]|uniref:phosphopantetheine-binding protein n=1 Tax=Pseudozobellia sp. WGM2 TaxID=2787625 RepID=UPI001AE026E4
KQLAAIWQEVLGREKIGIKDDFFEMGGHSLNAIKIINKVNNLYKIELKINQIFNSLTVEALSTKVKRLLWIKTSDRNNKVKNEI